MPSHPAPRPPTSITPLVNSRSAPLLRRHNCHFVLFLALFLTFALAILFLPAQGYAPENAVGTLVDALGGATARDMPVATSGSERISVVGDLNTAGEQLPLEETVRKVRHPLEQVVDPLLSPFAQRVGLGIDRIGETLTRLLGIDEATMAGADGGGLATWSESTVFVEVRSRYFRK